MWEYCGNISDKTYRIKLEGEETCRNVYLCPGYNKSFVPLNFLCDGVESCGMENPICKIARDFPSIQTTAERVGEVLNLCHGAFDDLQNVSCKRGIREVDRLPGDFEVFGAASARKGTIRYVNAPDSKISCSNVFGEYYVYLSCLNLCIEPDITCPLSDEKPLLYDSCAGQFPDRVYTLANNSFLTFARESDNGKFYYDNYFQCKNQKCVALENVCDLVDDCGDQSDEDDCKNHMVCEDTAKNDTSNRARKHLISLRQRCDGIYDCFDLSDECNIHCRPRAIIGSLFFKCFCWLMGILSVILNSLAVFRGLCSIKTCMTGSMLITQTLVSVVGTGDVLMGVYLVLLSIYDTIVFGKNFCRHQVEWLASTGCAVLGVISTFGSQLSLFAMTVLSFIRAYGLISNQLKPPSKINRSAVLKAVVIAVGVVGCSLAIAVVPLIPDLEDYFVQGMYYDPEYKVFIGFPNKRRHLEVFEAYFNYSGGNNHVNGSTFLSHGMSWQEIGEKVDEMFSKDHGQLGRYPVHFYGNDGFCLFKYFVRSDDARRSRNAVESGVTDVQGDLIVWLMLGLNFACFVCITICYTFINIITIRSSRVFVSDQKKMRQRRQREIQTKVTLIVATDFFCWVPFIIISALHNWKVIDATYWYGNFTLTVIPLNSVINPVIYDNELKALFTSCIRKLLGLKSFAASKFGIVTERDQEAPKRSRSMARTVKVTLTDICEDPS